MKKIIVLIIAFTIFFSSLSNIFAEEGYIERLLDLNYGVEDYNLDLSNIDYIYFKEGKYNRIYNELKTADSILKNGFMKKYRSGEYEYYKMSGIVKNYNSFVYHTNQFFFFLKMKEQNSSYGEINSAILKSYRNMRSSYRKVKNIAR